MDIKFLSTEIVLAIHAHEIDEYGGIHGVRDTGLLDSAISMPFASFGGEFLHIDIFEMAAAYLFHLCKNHAFIDGNKRTALATALTFLEANALEVESEHEELVQLVLGVAEGRVDKPTITEFFRAHTIPTSV